MMDVSIKVSYPNDLPSSQSKSQFSGFIQLPREIPDPKECISRQRQQVRPWLTFIQTSNFKIPQYIPRLGKRLVVTYFRITSQFILIVLAGIFYVGYKLNKRNTEKKLTLFGKELTIAQQYGLLGLCSMPIYYFVGGYGARLWVIGASVVLITLHAAVYNIDDLINNGDDPQQLLEEV